MDFVIKKIKSKYNGLSKRLSSIEFILDLALMCDILFELSQLSLELQKHEMTLIQADLIIKRTIRFIDSFKNTDGVYFTEALKAKENMIFKNITLCSNNKFNCINKNQFITSIVNNLHLRLIENNDEEKMILQDFQILKKKMWPIEVDIRFGENEIRRICDFLSIKKNHLKECVLLLIKMKK